MEGWYRLDSGRRPSFHERSYTLLRGSTGLMSPRLDRLSILYVVIFEPEADLSPVVRWVRALMQQVVFSMPPDCVLGANNKLSATAPPNRFRHCNPCPGTGFP